MAAAGLAEAASEFAEGARAENTRRAYAADWADFSAWCIAAGSADLPAEPTTVANYLTAKAGELAVSTLARRLAAIRTLHLEADQVAPDSAELRVGEWKKMPAKFAKIFAKALTVIPCATPTLEPREPK
jgi:site-specific recombinase XerD